MNTSNNQGTCSVREMMTSLHRTKLLHDTHNVINEQRQEEFFAATIDDELDKLVTLEASRTRKKVRGNAWAISFSPEYFEELLVFQAHRQKQRDERNIREIAWIKVITEAVKAGKDVATIRKIAAEENGDLEVLVQLPNMDLASTCCLLTLAAWESHMPLVAFLLKLGFSVEGRGTLSFTPLTAATIKGDVKIVEALLASGADCLAKSENGNTALHLAAYYGHQECVAVLIGATLAATHNTPECIVDNNGCNPVHAASIKGRWEVIGQLRDAGWSLHTADQDGNTVLHKAAWSGSVSLVERLVAAGLNLDLKNKNDETPLNIAVRQGNHDVEAWILKQWRTPRLRRPTTLAEILHLIKEQMEHDIITFNKYILHIKVQSYEPHLTSLLKDNDPHLMDNERKTALHVMAEKGRINDFPELLESFGHHHVLTFKGQTPLDLARRSSRCDSRMADVLETHHCPKVEGSPEELYLRLLTVISKGDNGKVASQLLCAGAPMELTGDFPSSALQQAVTNDRPRIVNLLLASGASITASTQGLNLLQQAWYSPNSTPKVLAAITVAFSRQLKQERDLLPRSTSKVKGLRNGLAKLIEAIHGDTPWEAGWLGQGKTEGQSATKLTHFMVTAAQTNCPLIVSFLRWAGAWPFFSRHKGTSPLHAALRAGHHALAEMMVRDLGASLYIPDATHGLPRDMEEMPASLLTRLELLMYQRERARLEVLAKQQKDKSEKEKMEGVLAVQEALFQCYREHHTEVGVIQATGVDALLTASRVGLLQLLHLLLTVGRLPPDTVVDVTCGTTALHEAAAHGKSGCVAHMLWALQAAAAANARNVAAIAAAATTTTATASADNPRLDRYSPLQPDRYGQTALILAAMFGHQHTLELLFQCVGLDPPCRAGTNAEKVHHNFTGYLRRYRRYNDAQKEAPSPLDQWDATVTLKRLLNVMDIANLPSDSRRANVDFGQEDEAGAVRDAVLRAAGVLLGRAAAAATPYMGGRRLKMRLVGSSRDGSKMFCPDEFDINVVVDAGDGPSVAVHRETEQSLMYKGHALRIDVETKDPNLRGERLAWDLYEAVREALTDCVLDDGRLSVVPPGLTQTQVGVALALAWQGNQYPLLLVGVDLVPVLEVPWHSSIGRPPLTPPGTSTMHLSATTDGSWRCSFAQLEAEVLAGLSPEERSVQLCAKLLLANL